LCFSEQDDVDLQAGGKHQQELPQLGEKVGDRRVLAEETEKRAGP
jgi:hypothetical protein